MDKEILAELEKLYKLTGVKLSANCDSDNKGKKEKTLGIIKKLQSAYKEKFSPTHILYDILTGGYTYPKYIELQTSLKLKSTTSYRMYIVHHIYGQMVDIPPILSMLFPERQGGFCIPIDEKTLVFLYMHTDNISEMLLDSIATEALTSVHIAYSDVYENLSHIATIYQELSKSLNISLIFYPDKRLIPPTKLGIGELIYPLSSNDLEIFLKRHIKNFEKLALDEESIQSATVFFRNNLSIAETARILHMHRNTFVYRLEQIEKKYGIDIKTFEGASIFNIAIMILNYLSTLSKTNKGDDK